MSPLGLLEMFVGCGRRWLCVGTGRYGGGTRAASRSAALTRLWVRSDGERLEGGQKVVKGPKVSRRATQRYISCIQFTSC